MFFFSTEFFPSTNRINGKSHAKRYSYDTQDTRYFIDQKAWAPQGINDIHDMSDGTNVSLQDFI